MLARGIIYFNLSVSDFWQMTLKQYCLCLQEYKKCNNMKEIEILPDEAKEILYKFTPYGNS